MTKDVETDDAEKIIGIIVKDGYNYIAEVRYSLDNNPNISPSNY